MNANKSNESVGSKYRNRPLFFWCITIILCIIFRRKHFIFTLEMVYKIYIGWSRSEYVCICGERKCKQLTLSRLLNISSLWEKKLIKCLNVRKSVCNFTVFCRLFLAWQTENFLTFVQLWPLLEMVHNIHMGSQ